MNPKRSFEILITSGCFNHSTFGLEQSSSTDNQYVNYGLDHLRWLKTVSSTFQDVDFDGSLLPLFYKLMLQSWYQKTAQLLVNTLLPFS